MKFTKKKVFVTCLAVCLMVTLSMGSLAWFSATDSVTNKFMVAYSGDPSTPPTGDSVFSVDVWEYTDDTKTVKDYDGHEYTNILPGSTYVKEPHVVNTGAYNQYIRVIVTISDAIGWINAVGENIDMTTVVSGFDAAKWARIDKTIDTATTNTITYVLYYNGILQPGDTNGITVFEKVTVPDSLTQAQAAAFGADGFTIDVKAQAVQTENVGANAYQAFQTVGMGL